MTAKQLPPPPAAKRAPASPPPPTNAPQAGKRFGVSTGCETGAQRVLLYGVGGVGKTHLAAIAPNAIFLDLENGSRKFNVARAQGVETYADVRAWLASDESEPFATVVIDTMTKLEEIATEHVLQHVPHDKPNVRITSIESYGFGKGYRHMYEHMALVLQDCDRLVRAGKNVILIAHAGTGESPNPKGDDWMQYQPKLQHPKKGENSVRERVFNWADHCIFVGYDVAVDDNGKGQGAGTRTIYPEPLPSHMAKTRGAFNENETVPMAMQYEKGDGSIWQLILGGAA